MRSSRTAYKEASVPVEDRVRDLLARMTLSEKIRQMGMTDSARFLTEGAISPDSLRQELGDEGIGAVQDARLAPSPPAAARVINSIQRFLVKETRLGIPALVIGECLHGHMSVGATVFPQAIGLASTWNAELVEKVASATAQEAGAVGVTQALAPDLDLARDPRWGRVEETYGEDPYLCERLGVAYVHGIQGHGEMVAREHLIATPKHFAAHGSPQSGINLAPVATGPRELHSVYLRPFRAAVVEAGALSVMPAYSELDGVPCSASHELLEQILKGDWGFRGYTFADYGAIQMLQSFHRTAGDLQEAGRQAVMAGLDLEAPAIACYGDRLRTLVEDGVVPMARIDDAVSRILRVKFLAGLFERDFVDDYEPTNAVNCPANVELALEAARESIILLKNEGGVLPLSTTMRTIAVIGPNADTAQLGDYSVEKREAVTPLQGIWHAVSPQTAVHFAPGCGLHEHSEEGIPEAVAAAECSEVAIVVVGGCSKVTCGVGWGAEETAGVAPTCGEGFDRTDLNLPGIQQQLVEAVVGTGTPTVVVLTHGRPYSIEWISQHAAAIVDAWYPGEQGGRALADVLFGHVNPSGRLPVTVPRSVGHVPAYYNRKPSAGGYYRCPGAPDRPGRDYVFSTPEPLFPFGFGLSYTSFEYSDFAVEPRVIASDGAVTVRLRVSNTGDRGGHEVVQLYLSDLVSSVTTPVRSLRGFRKLYLGPGESQDVEFVLGVDDLAVLDRDMGWGAEPGVFEVQIGALCAFFEVRE